VAAPVPFYSSPALLIQLKFDLTLLLFCGFRRATLRMLAIQANRSQIFTKKYVRVIRHSTHHLEFGEPADRNSWASLLPDLSSLTQEGHRTLQPSPRIGPTQSEYVHAHAAAFFSIQRHAACTSLAYSFFK